MTPRPPAVQIMQNLGLAPDRWQVEVLESTHPRLLLNCCRQAGKSTAVAVLALVEALFVPGTKVLLLSRSLRQSSELFRIVTGFHRRLGKPLQERANAGELLLSNFSRIVCLPCNEDTIRGFSHVSLLIIDEAARVPDDLYRAVSPMLAVSDGRMICLSTPHGKRGFFYDAWAHGGDDWARIQIAADQIPRIKPETLARERRLLGESFFRQEYCCSFEALEGLVFPDLPLCIVPSLATSLTPDPSPGVPGEGRRLGLAPAAPGGLPASLPSPGTPGEGPEVRVQCVRGRKVGGLDFGFRNPFAAVWGVLDKDDILWLTGEHYASNRPLSFHATRIPRDVQWHADPSGANERSELLHAGFTVRAGNNSLRSGIAAVSARIENGGLRILEARCPNLVREAQLYRYSDDPRDRHAEVPIDEHNHALSALRYLILALDKNKLARPRPTASPPDSPPPYKPKPWLRLDNEELWTRIY